MHGKWAFSMADFIQREKGKVTKGQIFAFGPQRCGNGEGGQWQYY